MRVVIDTCVLFPPLTRRLVLDAADAGLFTPLWSERILEEWRRALVEKGGGPVGPAHAAMSTRWPESQLPARPEAETALHYLPDPADAHVVAVAQGRAEVILTFNLRDFPARALAGLGLKARHPDGFLWQLLSESPEVLAPLISQTLEDHGATDSNAGRRMLKRARLPRLGKAWASQPVSR